MMFAVQFILALCYANLGEWLMHKFILHGLGKRRNSFWAYHWHEHHAVCAQQAMRDPGYARIRLTVWNAQTKELAVLAGIALAHAPLLAIWPGFPCGLYLSLLIYYTRHRKAHLDPAWGRRHLSWHYDHHTLAKAGNWCVTWPWCDYLFGTRLSAQQSDEADRT